MFHEEGRKDADDNDEKHNAAKPQKPKILVSPSHWYHAMTERPLNAENNSKTKQLCIIITEENKKTSFYHHPVYQSSS